MKNRFSGQYLLDIMKTTGALYTSQSTPPPGLLPNKQTYTPKKKGNTIKIVISKTQSYLIQLNIFPKAFEVLTPESKILVVIL